MNNSKLEQQALEAAQVSANALSSFDKPDNCAKLKKTRRVVGLPESTRRSYNADDMPACNWNGMAATIVDDIRFNTKTHKRPKAASIAYWQAYFKGCSEQKVRTAIRDALASGLLKVTYKMFNGSNTPHYLFVGTGVEFNTPVEINTPLVEFNTTITDSISSSNLDSKYTNKHSHSGDATAMTPEAFKESQGKDENPTPDAVIEAPKFEGKKTGPKPKAVTLNGDWQHYNRLAKTHDMEALLKACIDAGLVAPYRVMLADDECSMLDRIEYGLRTSPHDKSDTLESLILGAKDWPLLCELFEHLEQKDLKAPAKADLKFFTKHILGFLADPELVECSPEAAQQASAPAVEPVVLHALTADDYEPCDEPPDDYVKATPTQKELLAAVAAQQAAKQAAKNKATMFQHKHVKASATA